MVSKQAIALIFIACLVFVECAPSRALDKISDTIQVDSNKLESLNREKRVGAPWWCNAAVTKCNGGEDPCCYGWWANPRDACRAACAQCNRAC